MKQKGLKVLLIALVVLFVFGLSGCINSKAEPFVMQQGVTLCPYYDGKNYGTQVYIYSERINSYEVDDADDYIYDVLSSQFETLKVEGYPLTGQEPFYAVFAYEIKINEEDWFFNGTDDVQTIENRFFTAKITVDYTNPFSLCFKEGTKFNKIYKAFTQESTGPAGTIDEYFNIWGLENIDYINAAVLMGGTYTLKAETGGVMFDTDYNYHYYSLATALNETKTTRLKYSYSAVQSYAWFALAVVFGLLAVVLVLLLAKKMSGRVVDAKRKKAVQPTVEFIFDPFDNSSGGPNNPGGSDTPGGTSGSGSVFDGF